MGYTVRCSILYMRRCMLCRPDNRHTSVGHVFSAVSKALDPAEPGVLGSAGAPLSVSARGFCGRRERPVRWVLEHRVHGRNGESRGGTRGLQERGCVWCLAESGTAEPGVGQLKIGAANDPL